MRGDRPCVSDCEYGAVLSLPDNRQVGCGMRRKEERGMASSSFDGALHFTVRNIPLTKVVATYPHVRKSARLEDTASINWSCVCSMSIGDVAHLDTLADVWIFATCV